MDLKELSEDARKTSTGASRAIYIIKIAAAFFILLPLVLAWCFGALRFR